MIKLSMMIIKIITNSLKKNLLDGYSIQFEIPSNRCKDLSVERCLKEFRPHFSELINNLKVSYVAWKNNLAVKVMFKSSKDNDEEQRDIFLQYDTDLVRNGNLTRDIIYVIFQQLLMKYQEKIVVHLRGSDFIYNYIVKLYYNYKKIILNKSGPSIESPDWINIRKSQNHCSKQQ